MRIDPQKFWPERLPGWKMGLNVVSRYRIEVLIVDDYGRQAGATGTDDDLGIAIATCEQYVLDIERQISKNFERFLYDLFVLKLNKKVFTNKEYNYTAIGSWFIEIADKQLIFDGNDGDLTFRHKEGDVWLNDISIKIAELTIKDIDELIEKL